MITFFRKIRQQLLVKNKFSKYVLYAIGEIILVVIGILIALQINNWNEEKNKADTINIYLKNLVVDLNADIQDLEFMRDVNTFRFYSLQQILVLSENNPNGNGRKINVPPLAVTNPIWKKAIPTDFDSAFTKLAFEFSTRVTEIKPNNSTMDEFKNSGLFSQINDQKIKNAINGYYFSYEWRLGDTENQNIRRFYNDWMDILVSNGYTPEEIADLDEAIVMLKENPRAVAVMRNLIANAQWRLKSANKLIGQAQNLIVLIDR